MNEPESKNLIYVETNSLVNDRNTNSVMDSMIID